MLTSTKRWALFDLPKLLEGADSITFIRFLLGVGGGAGSI